MFIVMLVGAGVDAGSERIVARGDGITVTSADLVAMKKTVKQSAPPSGQALVEGTLRVKLFAQEARREGVDCPVVVDKSGFEEDIALAGCYLQVRLDALTTDDEAVESYYRAFWRRFVNKKDGKLQELDAGLQKKIRSIVLAAKKNNFGLEEYGRLCKKYDIVFVHNGS